MNEVPTSEQTIISSLPIVDEDGFYKKVKKTNPHQKVVHLTEKQKISGLQYRILWALDSFHKKQISSVTISEIEKVLNLNKNMPSVDDKTLRASLFRLEKMTVIVREVRKKENSKLSLIYYQLSSSIKLDGLEPLL